MFSAKNGIGVSDLFRIRAPNGSAARTTLDFCALPYRDGCAALGPITALAGSRLSVVIVPGSLVFLFEKKSTIFVIIVALLCGIVVGLMMSVALGVVS